MSDEKKSSQPQQAPRSSTHMSSIARKKLEEEEHEHDDCEKKKKVAIDSAPLVRYMLRAMAAAGCAVNPKKFIECKPCGRDVPGVAGALSTNDDDGHMTILLCQDRCKTAAKSKKDFNSLITHELIHAYDLCRANVDTTNCDHHACTEIRAANLSGDCGFWHERRRGAFKSGTNYSIWRFEDHYNVCVRRRAIDSVAGNPWCGRRRAAESVNRVWQRCIRDLEPFGAVPYNV